MIRVSTPDTPQLDEPTLDTIDRWLAYRVWHSRVPGAQVAIAIGDDLVFSRAYGLADLTTRTPLRTDHLFHVASHSKTFTATLVMQLVEQERLALTDAVADHVPELADHDELGQMCVRELLEHTSGLLRDGHDADHWQHARAFPDRERLIELVLEGPKHGPGELFAYSNLGYSLLGLIIESVTGQDFALAVDERLTGPLGLTATSSGHRDDLVEAYATGHSGLHVASRREPLPHVPTAAMDSATGFTSTATDLVRWFAAHRLGSEQLLTDRTKRLMQRPVSPTDPTADDPAGAEKSAYGWGLAVETVGGRRMIGHGGGYPGHITRSLSDPTTGLAVSVLTNAVDGPAGSLATGMIDLIDDAGRHPVRTSATRAAGWLGRYRNTWTVIDLGMVGGRLLGLRPTAQEPLDGMNVLVVDGGQLRIAEGSGYGSVGETVARATDEETGATDADGEGRIFYGGMSLTPWPELPAPEPGVW